MQCNFMLVAINICHIILFSPIEYRAHVPYISGRPTIFHRTLTGHNLYLVLASDGLWNSVKARDCFNILLQDFQHRKNCSNAHTSDANAYCSMSYLQGKNENNDQTKLIMSPKSTLPSKGLDEFQAIIKYLMLYESEKNSRGSIEKASASVVEEESSKSLRHSPRKRFTSPIKRKYEEILRSGHSKICECFDSLSDRLLHKCIQNVSSTRFGKEEGLSEVDSNLRRRLIDDVTVVVIPL